METTTTECRDVELATGLRSRTVRPLDGGRCVAYGCEDASRYGVAPGSDRKAVGPCEAHAVLGSSRGWLELDAGRAAGRTKSA